MTQRSNFLVNRTIIYLMHKLSPGLLPRLHEMCGKILYFITGGIVENIILHKIILFNFILFYLFYSIFNFVRISLGVRE